MLSGRKLNMLKEGHYRYCHKASHLLKLQIVMAGNSSSLTKFLDTSVFALYS